MAIPNIHLLAQEEVHLNKKSSFLVLKPNFDSPVNPTPKRTVSFNVKQNFYNCLFFSKKLKILLKKKTNEKDTIKYYYFSNKCITNFHMNYDSILNYTDFLKQNLNLSCLIEQHCKQKQLFCSVQNGRLFQNFLYSAGTEKQEQKSFLFIKNFQSKNKSKQFILLNKSICNSKFQSNKIQIFISFSG